MPWANWNGTYYAATTSANTGTLTIDPAWGSWNATVYLTISADSTAVWGTWNTAIGNLQFIPSYETAEQREARQARERVAQQEAAAAKERAWKLLRRQLRPDQRKTLKEERYFDVLVGDERRRYRITEGIAGNVFLIGPNGQRLRKYCIHPREDVPVGDVLLAQKLMLETEEREFLRIANVTQLRAA